MTLATSLAALLLDRGLSFVVIGVICGVCALLVLPLLAGIKNASGTVLHTSTATIADES